MRVLVYGAGAIGSVLGGFLAKAGHEVAMLGRAWHLEAIKRQGLTIRGIWGEHHVSGLRTATQSDDPSLRQPYDWIFVCVKAHQTAEVVEALSGLLEPKTLVCAFQNGLGNYETLTARIDPARVALGRVIFGVEIEPGAVCVTVCADAVLLGAPDPRFPLERLTELVGALQASGIPARPTERILTVLWAKVLYNCSLNGLSALLEVPYGALREHPLTPRIMRAIIEEAYQVAAAHHIALEPPAAQAYAEQLMTRLIPATAGHRSSMLQDLKRGRPTEIDAMNGAIVRLAQQAGLEAPMNALITRLVHAKERLAGVGSASVEGAGAPVR